jgi:hypothetical protein
MCIHEFVIAARSNRGSGWAYWLQEPPRLPLTGEAAAAPDF